MTQPSPSHYTLRYVADTPLNQRKHRFTEVHAETWAEAEDARLGMPPVVRDSLEVVERGGR